MDCWEAIKTRRSLRDYSPKPISREVLEGVVDCARFAPTARAIEPWEFVVITKGEALRELAAITDHGKFLAQAAAGIVVLCADTKYYLEDGCAATQNILLAARAAGLGSCWIAGDKKPYAPKALEYIGAPSDYKLISIVSLGYPQADIESKKKRRLGDLLHWEKF
jgi:nitroreductase